MKSTAIVCAIAAAAMSFGSLSFAQGQTARPGPISALSKGAAAGIPPGRQEAPGHPRGAARLRDPGTTAARHATTAITPAARVPRGAISPNNAAQVYVNDWAVTHERPPRGTSG